MYLKIHDKNNEKIVAACDKELIGKILEDGKYFIDLKNYSSFYKGEECTEKELENALENFTSVNLIGKKAVGVAIRKKLVSEDDITLIKSFPFIQIYKL